MQEHYEYLKTIPAFKGYFDYAVSVGFDLPETQISSCRKFFARQFVVYYTAALS